MTAPLFRRAVLFILALAALSPAIADQVQLVLRARLSGSGAAPRLELEGRGFRASPLLSCFYERRDFKPAWSTGGILRPEAGELLAALSTAKDDAPLEEAVRGFQERHGLEPDGAAGPATLAELNQRPEDHVRQIEVNLERWRWLPRDLGRRHVLVNIAAFGLEAVDDGRTTLDMRVIVGKPYTRTPMFSSAMNAVVLNPSWYVPQKIAVNEILPKARTDSSYLQRNGYEVLSGSRLRQKPGPQNALGRIKFVFPNRFSVYLHDTPSRTLFSSTVRTFSHGCIRIEKPFDLAVWTLDDDPAWPPEAIRAAIDAGRERQVLLARAIPVHVAYWTAWVDDRGTLRLGRDVYQRDAELAHRLGMERTVD